MIRLPDPSSAPALPALASPADLHTDADARAAVEAVLRHAYVKAETPCLVLASTSGHLPFALGGWCGSGERLVEEIPDAARRAFRDLAATATPVPVHLDVGVPVLALSVEWLRYLGTMHEAGFWQRYHQRFPGCGGLLEVSAVLLLDHRDRALVRVGRAFGYLMGVGDDYLLEKRDGTWRVVANARVWTS